MIGFSNMLIAQDWALFPYGQKSYYDCCEDISGMLREYYNDSIRIEGEDKIYFFNKQCPNPELATCYQNVITADYIYGNYANIFFFDSLIEHNDTIFYSQSDVSSFPFYFLPHANIGQSWSTYSDNPLATYNELIFSCDSLVFSEIFPGVFDSIKYYSIHSTGPLAGENNIDSQKFILSKSYGLLHFTSLYNFLWMIDDNYNQEILKGLTFEETKLGIAPPNKWTDYFNYQIGDVRIIKSYSTYFGTNSTKVYKIIDVFYSEYKIIYTSLIDTIEVESVYNRDVYQPLLESPAAWPLLDIGLPGKIYDEDYHPIYMSDYIYVDEYYFPGELTYLRSFEDGFYNLLDDCEVYTGFEGGGEIHYNSKLGWTSRNFSADGNSDGSYLIGGIIMGQPWGDTSALSISSQSIISNFNIFPNPATDFIFIDIPSPFNYHYSIYTYTGELIDDGMLMENRFNVAHLQQGMYFLQLKNEDGVAVAKFVKQ